MESLHNIFRSHVAAILQEKIRNHFNHEIPQEKIYSSFNRTPSLKDGHLAFPTFILAKELKQAPPQIAAKLISDFTPTAFITKIEAKGPYLNIFYNLSHIAKELYQAIDSQQFFTLDLVDQTKTKMFEYSQPNTHKELHVGHMRNLCLGNALVRLNRYLKHKVIAATYPGDMGTHVAKCLWFLHNNPEEQTKLANSDNKGAYLGQIYALSTRALSNLNEQESEQAKREMAHIIKEIDSGTGYFFDLWKKTREYSIELFKKTYKWADVEFDRWYYESEVDRPSLERIQRLYAEGKLIKDAGAIGMDLSDEKLGFCMLIKSDGNGLYATKDIELAFQKFEEYGLDESLYVVDKRQAHHFKQVFKTLEKIGLPNAQNCIHLAYDFVELPSGAMSSRDGNIIPLMELIHQMENTIKERFLQRHQDWSSEEIDELATIIANGAIKYGMIRIDNNRKIVFEMDEWLKLDGETGPYLQYVHARIATLLEKFPLDFTQVDFSQLNTPQEEALIVHLTTFNDHVFQAADQYRPSTLTAYLFDLGKLFNAFYAECPIGKAKEETIKHSRLALALMTKEVMYKGLDLLGIKAPARM